MILNTDNALNEDFVDRSSGTGKKINDLVGSLCQKMGNELSVFLIGDPRSKYYHATVLSDISSTFINAIINYGVDPNIYQKYAQWCEKGGDILVAQGMYYVSSRLYVLGEKAYRSITPQTTQITALADAVALKRLQNVCKAATINIANYLDARKACRSSAHKVPCVLSPWLPSHQRHFYKLCFRPASASGPPDFSTRWHRTARWLAMNRRRCRRGRRARRAPRRPCLTAKESVDAPCPQRWLQRVRLRQPLTSHCDRAPHEMRVSAEIAHQRRGCRLRQSGLVPCGRRVDLAKRPGPGRRGWEPLGINRSASRQLPVALRICASRATTPKGT